MQLDSKKYVQFSLHEILMIWRIFCLMVILQYHVHVKTLEIFGLTVSIIPGGLELMHEKAANTMLYKGTFTNLTRQKNVTNEFYIIPR